MEQNQAPATGTSAVNALTTQGADFQSTQQAPQSTAQAIPWLEGASEDVSAFVQNKKWQSPLDMAESYRNLEKYVGAPAEKIAHIPDFAKGEKAELDAFYAKAGRPSDPSGYKIPVPEGQTDVFAKEAANWFHEAGLNPTQAQLLAEKFNAHSSTFQESQLAAYQESVAVQEAGLRREWGAAFDQNVQSAKTATAQLGLKTEQIDALEKTLGFDGLLKMMSNIGSKIGEDRFISPESQGQSFGAMTPAQAQSRLSSLQQDKTWVTKYLNGNTEAKAEMERLQRFAYPQ